MKNIGEQRGDKCGSLESSRDSNRLASSRRDSGIPWKGTQCNCTTLHAHSAGTPTVSESHRADKRKTLGSYIRSISWYIRKYKRSHILINGLGVDYRQYNGHCCRDSLLRVVMITNRCTVEEGPWGQNIQLNWCYLLRSIAQLAHLVISTMGNESETVCTHVHVLFTRYVRIHYIIHLTTLTNIHIV